MRNSMKRFLGISAVLALVFAILSGCSSSGPREGLDAAAKALENKDDAAFQKVVQVQNLGFWTGLFNAEMAQGISSGATVAKCDNYEGPLCPWVPSALKKAKITKVDKDSAVAAVDAGKYKIRTWLGIHKSDNGNWRIVSIGQTKEEAAQFCSDAYYAKLKAAAEQEAARAAKLKAEQAEYKKEVAAAKAKAGKILDNAAFSNVKVVCTGNASQPVINVDGDVANHNSYPIFPGKVAFEIVDKTGHTVLAYNMDWHLNEPIMSGGTAHLHGIFRAGLFGMSPICKYYSELRWGGYSMKLSMAAIKQLDGSYIAMDGSPFINKIPRPGTY